MGAGASRMHVNPVSISQRLSLHAHLVKMSSTVQLKTAAFCRQDLPSGVQAGLPLHIHILLLKSLAIIPALGRQRPMDPCEFRASLSYLARPCLKQINKRLYLWCVCACAHMHTHDMYVNTSHSVRVGQRSTVWSHFFASTFMWVPEGERTLSGLYANPFAC